MKSNAPVDVKSFKAHLDQDHGSSKNMEGFESNEYLVNETPTNIPRPNEAGLKLAPKTTNVKMGQIQQTAEVQVSGNPKNHEITEIIREELKMEQVITNCVIDGEATYYTCNICNEIFGRLRIAEKHFKNIHQNKKNPSPQTNMINSYSEKQKSTKDVKICHYCDKQFESEHGLKRHMKVHMHKSAADRLKEATRDGASTNSIINPLNPENHGSEIPKNSEEKDHEKDSLSSSTDPRNPQILDDNGSEIPKNSEEKDYEKDSSNDSTDPRNPQILDDIPKNSEEKNQEENCDETIDITIPDFADISNDFRDSSQDFDENNQENLENPVNLEEIPDAALTVSTSEKYPQLFSENAKNPDVAINLKDTDSPQISEELFPTENNLEKSVNPEDHTEDLFPMNDDDQNYVNLEDHSGSQDLSSAGEFSENIADPLVGSEEMLNMSLSAALASETELMDITFRFFQDPNFLV